MQTKAVMWESDLVGIKTTPFRRNFKFPEVVLLAEAIFFPWITIGCQRVTLAFGEGYGSMNRAGTCLRLVEGSRGRHG